MLEEGKTTCCYAKSEKSWIDDPAGISWEAFLTTGEATSYGTSKPEGVRVAAVRCCEGSPHMTAPLNVLFLCTGNSARSIMAESILRKDGRARFRAFSAGSIPKGEVNPFALKVLASYGYPTDSLSSKSWEVFAAADAPKMDFVLTVCDNAAGEACPLWPGQPITAHWGIEDPAAVEGSDIDKERAFVTAFRYLRNRVSLLVNLPTDSLSRLALTHKLQDIGRIAGSTSPNPKVA